MGNKVDKGQWQNIHKGGSELLDGKKRKTHPYIYGEVTGRTAEEMRKPISRWGGSARTGTGSLGDLPHKDGENAHVPLGGKEGRRKWGQNL